MKQWRKAIYKMQTIEGMAGGLIGVFIPIYFVTMGYGLKEIFYYYIVNNFATLAFFFLAAFFARKFGFVKTLAIRLVFLFAYLFLIFNLGSYPWAFYVISVLSALEIAFYWFTLHVIFAKSADSDNMGEHVSKLIALPALATSLLPFFGAAISAFLGIKSLFVVAGLLYFASLLPLLFVRSIPVEVKISFRKIVKYASQYKRYFILETLLSFIGEIEGYLLPIFLYLVFKAIMAVGAVATYLGLGSALFTMIVGKFSDKADSKKLLRAGAFAMILVWLGRFVAPTQGVFYTLSVLAGFCGVLISIPFQSMIYRNAQESHVEDFIIFREIPISLGRLVLYGLALLLFIDIKLSFLAAAFTYLLIIFI